MLKLWVFFWMVVRNLGERDGNGHRMWFTDCWWLAGEWLTPESRQLREEGE